MPLLTYKTFQAGGNGNAGSSTVASNVQGYPGTTFNLIGGNSMIVAVLSNGAGTVTQVQDTAGNSFGSPITSTPVQGGGTIYWYIVNNCLGNAANVVTATLSTSGQTYNVISVWQISGGTLTYDTQASGTATGTAVATSSFNTQYANEVVVCVGWTVGASGVLTAGTGNGYISDTSGGVGGDYINAEHQIFSTTQTGIVANWTYGSSASLAAYAFAAGVVTYSISGNAGVAGATVSYSGAASGSVTANGSGNYTISGLLNGSYTITPSLSGYTFSPTSASETVSGANITGVNFTATPTTTPTAGPSSGLVPVQIFGRLPNGQIAAVSVDTHGNLAISGGTGGALNTVDVLGNGQATPAMVYGLTPSGKLVAVAVDANGNLCATVGSGGGNPNTTVDISAYTTPISVQVVGREPTSGKFYAVPLNGSDALYDSVNPGTTSTSSLSTPGSVPRPVVLCGRAPNGSIVAVALDSSGRLCISGSGSSGSVNTVDVYKNGTPVAIQLFGINASGVLAAVPLDVNGNLQLS